MNTIPVLLTTGHRLFDSLLSEARLALADEDWADVVECLEEFAARLGRHLRAEEDVLFPWLARINSEASAALAQCRREHREIDVRTHAALVSAAEHDKAGCKQVLSELADCLSCHCRAEERCIYRLTRDMDESTAMSLARGLSGLFDDAPVVGVAATAPPVSHALH